MLEFQKTYSADKKFAVAMLKELTEADVSYAQYLDADLYKFMKSLEPQLKDTIVILMSDHGILPKKVSH